MSSFGEELRRERELRRITLREVADATKINLRYLEALDRNDFKHLPGGVFNRGFVRAYAQFIGIDPEQMVTAYLMEEQAQARKSGGGPGGELPGGGELSEVLLRGSRSPTGEPEQQATAAEGSGKRLMVVLVLVLAALLIASGVFVYFKFFRGDGGPDRTDLPRQAAPAVVAARQPTNPTAAAQTADAHDEALQPSAPPPAETEAREPTPPPASAGTVPGTPPPTAAGTALQATIYIDRATTGRVNCDNRQIDLLNGMPPGTRFQTSCSAVLIVDADDGGALRIGWPGVDPTPPGQTGVPLVGHRIDVRALSARANTEERP